MYVFRGVRQVKTYNDYQSVYKTATEKKIKDKGTPAERIEARFGFATTTRFTDIQITLCADGRFWVYDNGVPFREMVRRGITKEKITDAPVVGYHPGLHGMLELGWDAE